jgi:carbonic anhydrase
MLSRRMLLASVGVAAAGGSVAGWNFLRTGEGPDLHHGLSLEDPKTPDEALARLVAGNECYISEHFTIGDRRRTDERRREVAPAQRPYAIVLACADSRVSPEIVFNAGLGDLFVVRVAGNIVNPDCFGIQGSIEFGIEELKIPLLMVLGHEGCGAVKAAIAAIETGVKFPGKIGILADSIRPVVEEVATRPGDRLRNAIAANVQQGVKRLRESVEVVVPAVASGQLKIVGGMYELQTGRVHLLD